MSITLLDQNTINKIAAGEVVERPSSVVKELVENAIDAGATAITVEIKEGGISFIRVTDNGSGINKDEIEIAFKRHATSKIKSIEDLMAVSSLGFRGEALASIAAVSQVELITKTDECLSGVHYTIDGGVPGEVAEIGAPEGTTFIVRNLFYNTPVRRKFLKTATTSPGGIPITGCAAITIIKIRSTMNRNISGIRMVMPCPPESNLNTIKIPQTIKYFIVCLPKP